MLGKVILTVDVGSERELLLLQKELATEAGKREAVVVAQMHSAFKRRWEVVGVDSADNQTFTWSGEARDGCAAADAALEGHPTRIVAGAYELASPWR